MENRLSRGFTLENKLAAVSAVMLPESTVATDGFNCRVYCFDLCGNLIGCTNTSNPYIRLRKTDCGYTAVSNCGRRIYFLNDCFVEEDFVDLRNSSGYGCNCGSSRGNLTDANLVDIGNEGLISGAFNRNAYLFDSNGRKMTRLCETDSGEILTDYLYLSDDLFAMSSLKGKIRTVTISANRNIYSGILNDSYRLRMLIYYDGAIYGLFGRCYLQNQIIKIYENGIFRLP